MASAWTHLGYAVPAGVFGQDPLALFEDSENDAETMDTGRLARSVQLFPLDWYDTRHVRVLGSCARPSEQVRPTVSGGITPRPPDLTGQTWP